MTKPIIETSSIFIEIEKLINDNRPTNLWGGRENGIDLFYNPYEGDLSITYESDREDFTYDYPLEDYELVYKLSEEEPTKELQFEDKNGNGGAVFVDDNYKVIAYIYNID